MPWSALAGGVLIGVGASVLLLVNGRVAGVSGILGGLFDGFRGDALSGALFLAAFLAVGGAAAVLLPELIGRSPAGAAGLAIAGLFVGVGTRLSGGCTSGHGVCGLSRGSLRSFVATLAFMATGAMTVTLLRVFGGRG